MNIVVHNLTAANAKRMLGIVTEDLKKKTEKLSSGYRINRAADDAAGLAISEKMRWQIRGLDRSAQNIQDGVSYCNVAEGALGEVNNILDRMKELSVQASNDTNTANDRQHINDEVQQLTTEMDRIFRDTEFNTRKIWRGAYIPAPSGKAEDFHLFNNDDGRAGGIAYGNHRYSWDDMGIKVNLDGTFANDFSVKSSAFLKDDVTSTKDDDFASAKFTLTGKKGGSVDSLQKTYSWSANDDGISIDGVKAKNRGAYGGDNTWSAMNLTKGQDVKAGTYLFSYFGQTISFDVEKDAAWVDFVDSINNPDILLDWHSTVKGSESMESANVTGLNNNITINSSNKDLIISNGYSIIADHDNIGIQYHNGATMTAWKDLSVNADGTPLKAWGDKQGGSSNATVDRDSVYNYDDKIISFDLKLNQNGSMQSITDDLKHTTISANTVAPSTIKMTTSTAAGSAAKATVSLSNVKSNVSFDDQRDKFGRSFATTNEQIAKGAIEADGTGYKVELKSGTGNVTLNSTSDIKGELSTALKNAKKRLEDDAAAKSLAAAQQEAKDKIKAAWDADRAMPEKDRTIPKDQTYDQYYNATYTDEYVNKFNLHTPPADTESLGLGTYSYTFTDGGNNHFTINYDLSSFTYAEVKNLADDAVEGLAGDIIAGNSNLTLDANGAATQSLHIQNASRNESDTTHLSKVDGFKEHLMIQSGALAYQGIAIDYDYLRTPTLGIGGINVLTYDAAQSAIAMVDDAIDIVSSQRALFGAYTNRLERAYNANMNTSENTSAAESRIRDADMAKEMVGYSKDNILAQAGQAVLAQANQQPQGILTLLQ